MQCTATQHGRDECFHDESWVRLGGETTQEGGGEVGREGWRASVCMSEVQVLQYARLTQYASLRQQVATFSFFAALPSTSISPKQGLQRASRRRNGCMHPQA